MIIVLAPQDNALIQSVRQQAQNSHAVFGNAYVVQADTVPGAAANENVFFIGHGLVKGSSGNPEIGDASGAFALDGPELWDNFKRIFPQGFTGSVFVNTCYAANAPRGGFSLATAFKNMSQAVLSAQSRVYGRVGDIDYVIPVPGDRTWQQI